jgi:membrane protein DedA with SNARE-associated domain
MNVSLLYLLDTPGFTNFIERFGYIGIFLWFISFDQLTPLPEEISLLLIGYLCAHQIFNPILAGLFSLLGFLTIDIIYFMLSKKGSSFIKKKTKGSSSLMAKYRTLLQEHTVKGFFILCFIPRMRLFAPVLAGSMKFTLKKFLLLDGLALIIHTTIFLWLGFFFNKSLSAMEAKVKGLQDIIFFSSIGLAAVFIMFFVIRRRKNKNENENENEK